MTFRYDEFVEGDIKGYEFDNPIKPTGAPWAKRSKKLAGANALATFLEAGCPRELFTDVVYDALNLHMFGHIAEFSIHGFYGVWFSTPEARANWVRYARKGGAYGFHDERRGDLWGDVERRIVRWLDESGVGDRLIAAADDSVKTRELALLAQLKAKYPDA